MQAPRGALRAASGLLPGCVATSRAPHPCRLPAPGHRRGWPARPSGCRAARGAIACRSRSGGTGVAVSSTSDTTGDQTPYRACRRIPPDLRPIGCLYGAEKASRVQMAQPNQGRIEKQRTPHRRHVKRGKGGDDDAANGRQTAEDQSSQTTRKRPMPSISKWWCSGVAVNGMGNSVCGTKCGDPR